MAYNYGYKADGSVLNGFLKWLQDNHYSWYKDNIHKISDLNPHFIEIRKQSDPDKPVAKETEKNAIYISKQLGFKKAKDYFNNL